jgi:subtilisin family serine protease
MNGARNQAKMDEASRHHIVERKLMSLKHVTLVFAALLAPALADPASAQSPTATFASGELLIGYQSQNDRDAALQELNKAKDAVSVRGERAASVEYKAVGGTTLKLHIDLPVRMRGRADQDAALELQVLKETAAQLKASDKRIKYAHPNWILGINPLPPRTPVDVRSLDTLVFQKSADAGSPNDYAYVRGLHWHYAPPPMGMNAVEAWKKATGSKDVVVAVVDSGILLDHPDIKASGNVLPGYNMVSSGQGRSADPTDPGDACPPNFAHASWHGTHVAGTIGAVGTNNGLGITGVNWSVSVVPVRVMGLCGRGTILDISDGIRWAAGLPVDGVPANQINKHPAHVINVSLGGSAPCNYEQVGLLVDAIDAARGAGSVVVVAAGNDTKNIADTFPAGCKNVISVAASDKQGHLAWYSNYGAVSIMAPGGDTRTKDESGYEPGVWSTVQVSSISPQGIEPMQGTSMAAPHVTAAIALALSVHPDWRGKPDLIAKKLKELAVPTGTGACSNPCGPGQLDAAKLVNAP